MKIIVFVKGENRQENGILQMVMSIVSKVPLTACISHEALVSHLSRLNPGCGIIVLLLNDKTELKKMLSIKDLFWNHKIILVLPDMNRETIADAVKLFPRYMTKAGADLSDVKSVLTHLLKPKGDGIDQ